MEIFTLPFEKLKHEKARLATLYSYNILEPEIENGYQNIVEMASYICDTPISLVSLVDIDTQVFKAKKGLEIQGTSRELSFCSHAILQDTVMEVEDALQDERFKNNDLVTGDPNIRFYAGAPLVLNNGHKLGTLCVIDREPKTLSLTQKAHLETLSRQIVTLMELKQQRKKLKEMNSDLITQLENRITEQCKALELFKRFVPAEIIAKHLYSEEKELDDAELKILTILFCDIRGYISIVEKLQPKQAVQILQNYYCIMSDIVNTYSGMVNQYVGDEVFATFGSPYSYPGYERNAVFCALEMMKQVEDLNKICSSFTSQPIKVGIGIHCGDVITGTLGSKDKIEYSVTGDSVNTGKRIESLTQEHPNTILISKQVYDAVKDYVEVKEWPAMPVKGKAEPLKIYEVLSRK